MNYLNGISIFDICQAYQQLEADYNVGGWLRERPSNQRRKESIGCQLQRMGFSPSGRWVDIEAVETDGIYIDDDENVRLIYCLKVLEWCLPIDNDLRATIKRVISEEYLKKNYPSI